MSDPREQLLRELGLELRRNIVEGVFLLQAAAERSGLNLTDLQCVYILTLTGPVTAGQLADITGLTTGAVTGVINRMEEAGYVTRAKDPDDGRRVVVRPVQDAVERAGLLDGHARALDEALRAHDDRDLSVLLDVTRHVNAVAQEEILRLRHAARPAPDAAPPVADLRQARLTFDRGASKVRLHGDDGLRELYGADFTGPPPRVTADDGHVTVSYVKRFAGLFDRRSPGADIRLNPAVPWAIELSMGAADVEADLSLLRLTSLRTEWGVSHLRLTLPRPVGAVPVRLSGGANRVSIRRPEGVPVRLVVKGTAAGLVFDGRHVDSAGGKVRLQSPDFDATADHYDIEVTGGAAHVTID